MKTLLKIVALGAAAYGVAQLVKKNKQTIKHAKLNIDRNLPPLAKVAEDVKLDPAVVESYRVQTKVLLDAFPYASSLDCLHTISFVDEINCEIFKQKLTPEYALVEQTDDRHCVIKEQISADPQSAFDAVLKMAQLASKIHANYHDFHFVENS